MKIAIVYDWIDRWGGVERLLLEIHRMFPKADFFTSAVDLHKASWAKQLTIRTSFLQALPDFIKESRIASLPFYQFSFETLSFDRYDTVISVTSSFAKSIITKPQTKHICILLTPSRYLYLYPHAFEERMPLFFLSPYFSYMRRWDRIAAQRPDHIISISREVARRCKKYYQRESQVIYPPFDLDYWKEIKNSLSAQSRLVSQDINNYYLAVSRLEQYKKIDLAINAFNRLPQSKLIIVGKGSLLTHYKSIARENTIFFRDVDDSQLAALYINAKALIMTQEEDFGYASVEAQFFGCPVVAYGKGGALETVAEGKTGVFFPHQTSDSLIATLERFDKIAYNFRYGMRNTGYELAQKFRTEVFVKKLKQIV